MVLYICHSLATTTITQEAVALFWETNRYENHLRKMRQVLKSNYQKFTQAIAEYFPEDTKVSRPDGGFALWVELNKSIDTLEFYENALRQKISIAPGRMFTLQNQFNNCLRLSFALQWNEKVHSALKMLGRLAKNNLTS